LSHALCAPRLFTALLKDKELAKDLEYGKKQLLSAVVAVIFTWLRQLIIKLV